MERGNKLDLNYPGCWFEKGVQLIIRMSETGALPGEAKHITKARLRVFTLNAKQAEKMHYKQRHKVSDKTSSDHTLSL